MIVCRKHDFEITVEKLCTVRAKFKVLPGCFGCPGPIERPSPKDEYHEAQQKRIKKIIDKQVKEKVRALKKEYKKPIKQEQKVFRLKEHKRYLAREHKLFID